MLIENIFYYLKNFHSFCSNRYIKIYKSSRLIKLNKDFKNFCLAVYNGKFFIPLKIKENMTNTNLKAFIFTRAIYLKTNKQKYLKKKKKK